MSECVWTSDENETPLAVDELQGLKPSLTTRAQLNELEQAGIIAARIWVMKPRVLARPDLLTDAFARELHRRMFSGVWKWAGKYRTGHKNLGWDWHRIPEGMRVLLDNTRYWVQHETYPLDEAAVRLHHQMVVIHPWPNGNGRHSRLMADVLLAMRQAPALSWGDNRELSRRSHLRTDYITALKAADAGDFKPLLRFART